MLIIADCHVHLYPFYNLQTAFNCALDNMIKLEDLIRASGIIESTGTSNDTLFTLFLTERADCNFFAELSTGKVLGACNFLVEDKPQDNIIILQQKSSDRRLAVVAGRQIITAEKLEILCLGRDISFVHKPKLAEAIEKIIAIGGIPVLTWSPGKWWFKRGLTIAEAIKNESPASLLMSDISLRPSWVPALFLLWAQQKKFKLLAGSDPLPFPKEETRVGRYCACFSTTIDPNSPLTSLLTAIRDKTTQIHILGKRDSFLECYSRLAENRRVSNSRV